MREENPDIIALNETFIKPKHSFNIKNYEILRNDVESGTSIATLIKKN